MQRPTTSRRRWLMLAVLCLSMFLVVVDNTIVNVALPTLSRELDASTSQLQWIVDAYSMVFAGLLLAGGSLGDRFGRRRLLQIGLVIFGATSVLASLAADAPQLIAARAAMGVGAALVFPATLAILTNVFTEPTERARAIGIWAGVSGLAVALGPVAGGWILRHFSWGAVFLVNAPIVVLALVAGGRLLPESRDRDAGSFDRLGFATSVAGITTLVHAIIEAPHRGWTSPTSVGELALAVVLLAGFALWERRTAAPLLDLGVFADLRFSAASLSVTVSSFGLFGFIFLVTQYFQFIRSYDALSAGVHTLPFAGAAMVTSPLSAGLALRHGTKRVVALGLTSMAAGFWVASTTAADSSYWGLIVPAMVLMAVGLGLVSAPATESIMGSLPPERAGVGSAVNDTTRELGGTLGVAVVGSVFSSVYGPRIAERLATMDGVPAEAVAAARESVVAALTLAGQVPEPGRGQLIEGVDQAFMDGMAAGSRVAAVACLVGAAVALWLLPARAGGPRRVEVVHTTGRDPLVGDHL